MCETEIKKPEGSCRCQCRGYEVDNIQAPLARECLVDYLVIARSDFQMLAGNIAWVHAQMHSNILAVEIGHVVFIQPLRIKSHTGAHGQATDGDQRQYHGTCKTCSKCGCCHNKRQCSASKQIDAHGLE